MARKETARESECDEIINLLNDAIDDLRKVKAGRPFSERYFVISDSIGQAQMKLFDLSPYKSKPKEDADESDDLSRSAITHKKPLALEHKPVPLFLKGPVP